AAPPHRRPGSDRPFHLIFPLRSWRLCAQKKLRAKTPRAQRYSSREAWIFFDRGVRGRYPLPQPKPSLPGFRNMNAIGSRLFSPLSLVFLLVSPFTPSQAADQPGGGAKGVVLAECLVIRPVGRSGRSPLHLDAIEAEVVARRWKAPKAGDKVTLPDGGSQTWEAATAKAGALDHAALRGGYAFWQVQSDGPRVMLLEASGHTMAYANGEPRTGDPYSNGIVRLPVLLRKGTNEFLFNCGRGRLQAKLTVPKAKAMLDVRDATLPDLVVGDTIEPRVAVVVINASENQSPSLALKVLTS